MAMFSRTDLKDPEGFEEILSFEVTTRSKEEVISQISCWIGEKSRPHILACANPHSLEIARRDAAFNNALKHADILVPDGIGIVIASKILGGRIRERVTGTDIFLDLSRALNKEKGRRYFFLGSTEQNLIRIKEKMSVDFPNIIVAGIYSPPFKPEFSEEDNTLMQEAIDRAAPDVLWVGMTAPKQEKWIHKNRHRLNVTFIGAIGAVFDFYTSNVKRSHPLFQKLGLEWLPRLLREPRRLWYRNFVSNPSFLLRVIRCRLTTTCKASHQS